MLAFQPVQASRLGLPSRTEPVFREWPGQLGGRGRVWVGGWGEGGGRPCPDPDRRAMVWERDEDVAVVASCEDGVEVSVEVEVSAEGEVVAVDVVWVVA